MAVSGGQVFPDVYPATNTGVQPPFTPSSRPHISAGSINHIMERHGDTPESRRDWPNKPKFVGWSQAQVEAEVDLVLTNPTEIIHGGDQFRFIRDVDGVR